MRLVRATQQDFDDIIAFYDDVTVRMPDMAVYARWSKGMKAVRLDALASNKPAHRIYERLGFEYRGKQHLYAENTGWTDFYFFEFMSNL